VEPSSSADVAAVARTLAAIIAYLEMLDDAWEGLTDDERKTGIQLALEAGRRARGQDRSGIEKPRPPTPS
jgi:hypothetical protein